MKTFQMTESYENPGIGVDSINRVMREAKHTCTGGNCGPNFKRLDRTAYPDILVTRESTLGGSLGRRHCLLRI